MKAYVKPTAEFEAFEIEDFVTASGITPKSLPVGPETDPIPNKCKNNGHKKDGCKSAVQSVVI